MKLEKLRYVENIQRASNGGSPTSNNDNIFDHGEGVFIISKREFLSLLYEFRPIVKREKNTRLLKLIDDILEEDHFIARAGGPDSADLPNLSDD